MPVEALVDDCPLYDLEPARARRRRSTRRRRGTLGLRRPARGAARAAGLVQPQLAPAAVRAVRLRSCSRAPCAAPRRPTPRCSSSTHDGGCESAIAVSIDGNGRRVACDPYTGTVEAVLECAANLACVGAEPLGLTNCLNFGNPEKPHVAWQLERSVAGHDRRAATRSACRWWAATCRSTTSPATARSTRRRWWAWSGALPDAAQAAPTGFAHEGDTIALRRGESAAARCRAGSWPSCAARSCRRAAGASTSPRSRAVQEAVRDAVRAGDLTSAHDVAEGGFLVAVAECCLAGGIGADAREWPRRRTRCGLFGEARGPASWCRARARRSRRWPSGHRRIGTVGGEALAIGALRLGPWTTCAARTARWLRLRLNDVGAQPVPSGCARFLAFGVSLQAPRPVPAPAGTLVAPGRHLQVSMHTTSLDHRDGPRDECGVFGVYAPESEVARLAYFALYALQHRGQESAGIAACEGGHIMTVRDLGLVSQVFDEQKLRALTGAMALGHVRYSTTGSSAWENAQPVYRSDRRQVALAHNGNLINAVELHSELLDRGVHVPLDLGLGDHRRAAVHPRGRHDRGGARRRDAAPAGRVLHRRHDPDKRVAFRDGAGLRPLSLGRLGDRYCVASESCAFDIIGAELVREVAARRDDLDRRARDRDAPGRRLARARRSASSSTSTSRGPTRSSRATAPRSRGARWARSSGARRRSRPTW